MMKKVKVKDFEELFKMPDSGEWVEVEFTEPVKVKSVYKETAKAKARDLKVVLRDAKRSH